MESETKTKSKTARPKEKRLFFVIEYSIKIEHNMNVDLERVLDTCSENGFGEIVDVTVREVDV